MELEEMLPMSQDELKAYKELVQVCRRISALAGEQDQARQAKSGTTKRIDLDITEQIVLSDLISSRLKNASVESPSEDEAICQEALREIKRMLITK